MNTFEYFGIHVHVAINVHVARYGSLLTPPHKVFSSTLRLQLLIDRNYRLTAVAFTMSV